MIINKINDNTIEITTVLNSINHHIYDNLVFQEGLKNWLKQ